MSTATTVPRPAALPLPRRKGAVRRFLASQPLGGAGLVVILVYAGCAVGASWLAPFDPEAIDFAAMMSGPGAGHWFGTDQFGRDVLSRTIYGARTALAVGLLSAVSGCTVGAVIGAASGYFGGWTDTLVQRAIDILLSFPIIVLAMVVVSVLGKHSLFGVDLNLIAAIAFPIVPKMARVARASALSVVAMAFVDAARTAGFSHARIVLRHIMPNIAAPFLIMVTAFIAQAILLEASLSFLGLGVSEPTPAWGLMLSGASAAFYQSAPWMILFPGIAISLAVLAFSLLGDSLRDWLDPKMRN